MKLSFIGSGIEQETAQLIGIEVQAVVQIVRLYFDTLLFGGSSIGMMKDFAAAFASSGGRVISIVPRWLEKAGLVYQGSQPVFCADLAERKKLMFEEADAVLCYPGGIGTWDELFDLLARRAVEGGPACPPVFLYSWEKYYAPLLLQMETAVEAGLAHPETLAAVRPFESVEELAAMLRAEFP
jgi:uncharacterized protein (TIGR00730 family)